jgi:uncharacterized damage-inducible protein DinB
MGPLVQAAIAELTYAHGELRQLLQDLPGEALTWQPGPEMNSLYVLITHLLGSEHYLLSAGAGAVIDRDREAEFRAQGADATGLYRLLDAADEQCRTLLTQITPDTLSGPVGGRRTGAWYLQRAVAHSGEHYGQALQTRPYHR